MLRPRSSSDASDQDRQAAGPEEQKLLSRDSLSDDEGLELESLSSSGARIDTPEEGATGEGDTEDQFTPFTDLPDERKNLITFRAITVGILCGALVNASNIYLGLKAGYTSSANIFGSIIGFTTLKACSKYFNHIPILGGNFGPRENNIVQTTATAAGGLGSVFVSAFPAMYRLELLSTPKNDYWTITLITALGGYFGLFFAAPLRKFFIILVARDLNLIFPSSSAVAMTIRSMHLAASGASLATLKVKALGISFAFAAVLRIISQYALGIFWDWHPFTWAYNAGIMRDVALHFESWFWYIEWTPAFIGSGLLVGCNVAISYVVGTILAWGIIGPFIVRRELAFGVDIGEEAGWKGLMNYASLSGDFATAKHPSPRYWLLWPGVACMIAVAITELACQWRIFFLLAKGAWKIARSSVPQLPFGSRRYDRLNRPEPDEIEDSIADISYWMWLPGLLIVIVLTCIVMRAHFGMPVAESLLALFLSFFFSLLAIQATGVTDITPLTAASKASQIILGATTSGPEWTVQQARKLNLLGGAYATVSAGQAADLTSDFRVGFLLNTSAAQQYLAQGIGTLAAVFIAPAIFTLFTSAYPCIISPNGTTEDGSPCPFTAPPVASWQAVAVAVTERGSLPIPESSKTFAIMFALFGVAMVLVRQLLLTGSWEWCRKYHLNMTVVSLAFIIPNTVYATAMLVGAVVALVWQKKSPASFDRYGYAVAAGFIAGEGIGGVFNAALQILGLSGEVWGTGAGCPAGKC